MNVRFPIFSIILCALVATAWANTPPQVGYVRASQRADDSKLVDITYNLADADGDACTVWIAVSNDGGVTWRAPALTYSGHAGPGVSPGSNKRIVWDAGRDMPGMIGGFRVRVYADDGQSGDALVLIQGGSFMMGDNFSEGGTNERPVHQVQVDTFLISRYEVTNLKYCEFLNHEKALGNVYVANGLVYGTDTGVVYCATDQADADSRILHSALAFSVVPGKENHPMVEVTWYGAAAYCNWKSRRHDLDECYDVSDWSCDFSASGYRLPTEAEWEYAARGGLAGKRFPWGNTISHSQANYHSSTSYSYDVSPTRGYHPDFDDGRVPYTAPVGHFAPNGYGLHDVAGNVWEWCNDWYASDYYGGSPVDNPKGPSGGQYRVFRGGSWNYNASNCRVADRNYNTPSNRNNHYGFRLVLDLD